MDIVVSSVPFLGTMDMQVPNTGTVDDVKWSVVWALQQEHQVWISPNTFSRMVGGTHVPFTTPLKDVCPLSFTFQLSDAARTLSKAEPLRGVFLTSHTLLTSDLDRMAHLCPSSEKGTFALRVLHLSSVACHLLEFSQMKCSLEKLLD